jgi:hypothetical protein
MQRTYLKEGGAIMECKKRSMRWFMATLVIAVILLPLFAFAGGVNHEPLGAEDELIGATPPPSLALKEYFDWYHATKLKNDNGRTMTLARDGTTLNKLNVFVAVQRLLYVTPIKLEVGPMTGFVNTHAVFPLVKPNLHLGVLTPGGPIDNDQSHSGLGDVTFGPGIGWHHKSGLFHAVTAVDFVAPTGHWNPNNLVNVGSNDWSIIPVFAFTLFAPFHPDLDFSMKIDYSFNSTNTDFTITPPVAGKLGNMGLIGTRTSLKPGQEFHFDYSIGHALWAPGPGQQMRGGVGGYFYQQTTDDRTGVGAVKHDLGRAFAVGPVLFFDYKKFLFIAHVYFETAVQNRPEGIQSQLVILYKF